MFITEFQLNVSGDYMVPCIFMFSVYGLCHVAFVIMSVRNFLSHLLPTISDTGILPCHDAELYSNISLCHPLPLFPPFKLFSCCDIFQFPSSHSRPEECGLSSLEISRYVSQPICELASLLVSLFMSKPVCELASL